VPVNKTLLPIGMSPLVVASFLAVAVAASLIHDRQAVRKHLTL
jgi:hypothetical protein